jgi:site-specific recombinase XerD
LPNTVRSWRQRNLLPKENSGTEWSAAPESLGSLIQKPILHWTDEDILFAFRQRSKSTCYNYNAFLQFLFFRGYHHPGLHLLVTLRMDCSLQWKSLVELYRQKIADSARVLGYLTEEEPKYAGMYVTLLLWLLFRAQKTLEEITRADFDAFHEEYQQWYKEKYSSRPSTRLYRLERYLIHWKCIPEATVVKRHEERLAGLHHEKIKAAILYYVEWCSAKYRPASVVRYRSSLLTFFSWFRERLPADGRLDNVTRPIALEYVQYLRKQREAGLYGENYCHQLHADMRVFFDFAWDEQLETAPPHNPFAGKDLLKKPRMIPRYLSDQELRQILEYCDHEATLHERTAIITLLHTGIRAAELASLKVTDIVQIQGVWKLHIHEGKGLKDRVIPLTPLCLKTLQTWQQSGWNDGWGAGSEYLFTHFGKPWRATGEASDLLRRVCEKIGAEDITPHRFRHTFAVALLNYGIRESALQKLMGHTKIVMTLEYARILDKTVEQSFTHAVEQMQEGPLSWVPNFFSQQEYALFAEADTVSWIQLPIGFCRRNPKLHCESDVKCLLCERFLTTPKDLPRLRQMQERFISLGLQLKADVVAAQLRSLEARADGGGSLHQLAPVGFIPIDTITATPSSK